MIADLPARKAGNQSAVRAVRKSPDQPQQFRAAAGFRLRGRGKSRAGYSRRRRRFLYAYSRDVCLPSCHRQRHPAEPAFSGPDGPSTSRFISNLPQSTGELPTGTAICNPPASLAGLVTTQISAFSPNFQTPYTEQANLTMQREFGRNIIATVSYEYVHGLHLIRSLDVNLPAPTITAYPVYNDTVRALLGMYDVASFTTEQTTQSVTCPYPPCINQLQRPDPQLGAINSFESQSSSIYNGMTVSVKRQMSHGMYFQVGYTLAKAVDDGQDALSLDVREMFRTPTLLHWSAGPALTTSDIVSWRPGWLTEVSVSVRESSAI